jgi:hypothetical protein
MLGMLLAAVVTIPAADPDAARSLRIVIEHYGAVVLGTAYQEIRFPDRNPAYRRWVCGRVVQDIPARIAAGMVPPTIPPSPVATGGLPAERIAAVAASLSAAPGMQEIRATLAAHGSASAAECATRLIEEWRQGRRGDPAGIPARDLRGALEALVEASRSLDLRSATATAVALHARFRGTMAAYLDSPRTRRIDAEACRRILYDAALGNEWLGQVLARGTAPWDKTLLESQGLSPVLAARLRDCLAAWLADPERATWDPAQAKNIGVDERQEAADRWRARFDQLLVP